MTLPTLSDTDFLTLLDQGASDDEIARVAGNSVKSVQRRKIKLAAFRAGAAVRACEAIVRGGIDQAAAYLLMGVTLLDEIEALADEAEAYRETKSHLTEAVVTIADREAGAELYAPAFHRLLERATDFPDPRPNLFKAIETYQKNMALYASIYETMCNVRTIAQLKELLLALLDIDNPTVRNSIERVVFEAETARGILGVDRYHPEPNRAIWTDEAEEAFQSLPPPGTLPDPRRALPGKER